MTVWIAAVAPLFRRPLTAAGASPHLHFLQLFHPVNLWCHSEILRVLFPIQRRPAAVYSSVKQITWPSPLRRFGFLNMNVLRHIVSWWRCERRCWCVGDRVLCGPTHYLRQRRFTEGGQMEAREVTCCNFWLIVPVCRLYSLKGHFGGPDLMALHLSTFSDAPLLGAPVAWIGGPVAGFVFVSTRWKSSEGTCLRLPVHKSPRVCLFKDVGRKRHQPNLLGRIKKAWRNNRVVNQKRKRSLGWSRRLRTPEVPPKRSADPTAPLHTWSDSFCWPLKAAFCAPDRFAA